LYYKQDKRKSSASSVAAQHEAESGTIISKPVNYLNLPESLCVGPEKMRSIIFSLTFFVTFLRQGKKVK